MSTILVSLQVQYKHTEVLKENSSSLAHKKIKNKNRPQNKLHIL